MNGLRNILCIATAMLLVSVASSVLADNGKKQFSLVMSAPPGQTSAPFTVTATVTNEGNSTINSFILSVTGMTIVAVNPPATGKASGPFPGPSASVTNMHPLKSGDSLTLTLQVNSCGDGTWSAAAWTGSSLNGQSFNLVPADSTLATSIACGNLASGAGFAVPDSLNPDCVTGHRGYYDKDGSVPTGTLPYFVTNTVPTNDQLHFRWPDFQTGGDPYATFEYAVCGTGLLPAMTDVAWLNTNGNPASTPGDPAYIPAQDCLDPKVLPTPYGTLTAEVGLTDSTIAINTTMPSGAPPVGTIPYPGSAPTSPGNPGTRFYIVLGTERIMVQLVCLDSDGDSGDTSDCTETDPGEGEALIVVERGAGGTVETNHPAGSLVMSTPLPLLPDGVAAPYIAGNQALMCIASQQGADDADNNVHSTEFIDIGGDGWANHP